MAGAHQWSCSEHLYPDPLDSRKRVPNPDYHPPIEYYRGKFKNMLSGEVIDKKDVPKYILEAVKNLPREKKAPPPRAFDLKDIMRGTPLIEENLTCKIREREAKERASAKRKARQGRKSNGRVQGRNSKVKQRAQSNGRGSGNRNSPERDAKGAREAAS